MPTDGTESAFYNNKFKGLVKFWEAKSSQRHLLVAIKNK